MYNDLKAVILEIPFAEKKVPNHSIKVPSRLQTVPTQNSPQRTASSQFKNNSFFKITVPPKDLFKALIDTIVQTNFHSCSGNGLKRPLNKDLKQHPASGFVSLPLKKQSHRILSIKQYSICIQIFFYQRFDRMVNRHPKIFKIPKKLVQKFHYRNATRTF